MTPIIELLPHNEKLYNDIKEHIEHGERSIFYSEATGLGKSFIFMRLVQEYFIGKRIMYIVPKIAIWDNLTHYTEFDYLDAEIEMRTFSSFNTYDSGSGLYNDYDVVFVDECHHMLSDIQGMNVAILLEDMYNNGKYTFGFTATPRYGDVYVDEMYFKASCYGYDVFEAIKFGLFPKIDVAIADVDINQVPKDLRIKYSISGTKTIIEQIIEERSDITHWLAYFGRKSDLDEGESEVRRLFPDFKILKLYQGVSSPREIIRMFEEYRGKVILMSVSMLLEGMHLTNVGGILLYRNVGVTNTYFQIYGRLCKIGTGTSPLLLDITNSVLNLGDFDMFKSSRVRKSDVKYSRRELFDVNSYSYRYVELSEDISPFKVKEYKGVRWTSLRSLDRAMGKRSGVSSSYITRNGLTAYDYIDSLLLDSTYDEYVLDGYVGKKKYRVLDKEYRCTSVQDLVRQLGNAYPSMRESNMDSYIEIITFELMHGFKVGYNYRGADISTMGTLSNYLSMDYNALRKFIKLENIKATDCVDMYLSGKELKGIKYINGVVNISAKTGKSISAINTMYSKLESMEKLINYYLPDERIYRGIVIKTNSTKSDIANQLCVGTESVRHYINGNNGRTIEDCIDYYLDKKDGIRIKGQRYDSYTDEEISLIHKLKHNNTSWVDITAAVNNLRCNIDRNVSRTPVGVRSVYDKLKTFGTFGDYKKADTAYMYEELYVIKYMRERKYSWEEVANKVNSLRCNVERGVTRRARSMSAMISSSGKDRYSAIVLDHDIDL